jgi:uncharacterized membrane protein YhaH (DUF805 family)
MLREFINFLFSPFGTTERTRFIEGLFYILMLTCAIFMLFGFAFLIFAAAFEGVSGKMNLDTLRLIHQKQLQSSFFNIALYILFWSCIITTLLVVFWCRLCLIIKRIRDMALPAWFAIVPVLTEIDIYLSSVTDIRKVLAFVLLAIYILLSVYPSRQLAGSKINV